MPACVFVCIRKQAREAYYHVWQRSPRYLHPYCTEKVVLLQSAEYPSPTVRTDRLWASQSLLKTKAKVQATNEEPKEGNEQTQEHS